jgi:oxalate---CoA ligase
LPCRTGDQGFLRPEFPHHLELTGRLKELINRGGEKISPLEVDSALLAVKDPNVKEAVCFGVEDEKYGEVVWAAVVLANGADPSAESKIQKSLVGKISKFKIPER